LPQHGQQQHKENKKVAIMGKGQKMSMAEFLGSPVASNASGGGAVTALPSGPRVRA